MAHNQNESPAVTPADAITPHDRPGPAHLENPVPEISTGIIDPRSIPGPDILEPPPPGFSLEHEKPTLPKTSNTDGKN